jgi:hypothetical protein
MNTIHYKTWTPAWNGYAWINTGGSKYHVGATVDDCHGWTSNDASSYLGSFWLFETGYTDAYGAVVNCGELKSLACCKVG